MTNDPEQAININGSVRSDDGAHGSIRMEGTYHTDIKDLWSALTDPIRLARWIATVEGDLRVGGSIHARFTSSWDGPGRIDVCDAPKRLVLTMEPGTSDETVIEAVLSAVGDLTHLVVEERGFPLAELAAHGAGWQVHIEDLASYLSGRDPIDWRARWMELIPRYRSLVDELE
jgi:uncharacterized protein YndB with AHSA1/START domain